MYAELAQRVAALERLFNPQPAYVPEELPPEPFLQFAARMSCPYVVVNGRFLFSNGARSNGYFHWEPPADSEELLHLRHEYVQAKRDSLLRQYQADRETIADQLHIYEQGAGPFPAPGWLPHLQALAREIDQLTAALRDLEASQRTVSGANPHDAQAAAEARHALDSLPSFQ